MGIASGKSVETPCTAEPTFQDLMDISEEDVCRALDDFNNPSGIVPLTIPRLDLPFNKGERCIGILLDRDMRRFSRLHKDRFTAPVFFMQVGKSPDQVAWFNGSSDGYDQCLLSRFPTEKLYPHEIEWLPGQAERDDQQERRKFFVYVLHTDCGHYIGHTADVEQRLHAHQSGSVVSTAGRHPVLIKKLQCSTRDEAALMESVLKTLRDAMSPAYGQMVGHEPLPWNRPSWMTETDENLWTLFEDPERLAKYRAVEITNSGIKQGSFDYRMNIRCKWAGGTCGSGDAVL